MDISILIQNTTDVFSKKITRQIKNAINWHEFCRILIWYLCKISLEQRTVSPIFLSPDMNAGNANGEANSLRYRQ